MIKNWKRTIKRPLALLLAGTLMLMSGCANTDSGVIGGDSEAGDTNTASTGNGAKGRYVETVQEGLSVSEGTDIFALEDGSFAINNEEGKCLEVSKDGGVTWTDEEHGDIYDSLSEDAEITGFYMSPSGDLFCSYVDWNNDVTTTDDGNTTVLNRFLYAGADGTTKEGSFSCESSSAYITRSVMSPDGRIFVADLSGIIYEIDKEAGTASKLFATSSATYQELYDCGRYLVDVCDGVPYIYDLEENKLLDTDTVLSDFLSENLAVGSASYSLYMTAGDGDDTLYVATSKGLYRHAIGGTVMEQLIDGALTSLGDSSKSITGMQQKEDGNFLMMYSDGTLCSYDYDANIASVPETEIKIYSLYDNSTIRQAISAYQKTNRDVYLNYQVGITDSSGMTQEDAIKNLNTDLMAGEGPDLLLLDGLPMNSYIEKGMLLDISDKLAELEGEDTYFNNILESYKTDSGIYAAPIRFKMPILAGKTDMTGGADTFAKLAANMEKATATNGTLLGTYTSEELLNLMYMTASPELMETDGTVNQDKLTAFLQEAVKLYALEKRDITDEMMSKYDETQRDYVAEDGAVLQKIDKLGAGFQTMQVVAGTQAVIAGYLQGGVYVEAGISGMFDELGGGEIVSMPGLEQTGKVYIPSGIAAISSKSNHTEEAEDFLSILYSNEVQQVIQSDGYPVNVTSFDAYFAAQKNLGYSEAMSSADGEDIIGLQIEEVHQADYERLKAIAEGLSVPGMTDSAISDAIIDQGAAVLDGSKSVDDGVAMIMQKVGLYAQE